MDSKYFTEINERYKCSTNRLILLDYDGTLVNFTSIPDSAILTDEITRIIRKLVRNPDTELLIITGRRHDDIDRILNHIPINIIAEHGAIVKRDGKWENRLKADNKLKKAIIPIMNDIISRCPGSFMEEKGFSLTWHYRNAEPEIGKSSSIELIHLLEQVIHPLNLKILDGNKVVEVLSDITGKGNAVKSLLEENRYDFILSIGDDATDEEMFEFLLNKSEAFTIKVGDGPTYAKSKLNNINDVASLLKQLSI